MFSFQKIAGSLVAAIIEDQCQKDCDKEQAFEKIAADFVVSQYRRMPDYLRFPMFFATIFFNFWALITRFHFFYNLPTEKQIGLIQAWRQSRLGPFRDFVKFYQSLTLLSWYDSYTATLPRKSPS